VEKGNTMKSRSLFRALCAGAALLVPAGGLTMFSVGTAQATTGGTLTFGASSTVTIGSLGVVTLYSLLVPTNTTIPTPAPLTIQFTKATFQAPIRSSTADVLVKGAVLLSIVTHTTVNSLGVKSGWVAVLKHLSLTFCKLATMPAVTAAKTSTTGRWTASGISLSGVKIKTTGGTCSKKSTLASDLGGSNRLSVTLAVSVS
jgi:hypothetical protein